MPVLKLPKVLLEMTVRNVDVSPRNPALHVRPKPLDSVRVNLAPHILTLGMVDRLAAVFGFQDVEPVGRVGEHARAAFDVLAYGPGDVFGELAIFDHRPRSAGVQAVTDCVVLRVDEGLLQALAGLYPAAAYKLMVGIVREIAERLRRTNVRYIDSLVAAPHLD